jgi:mannan endo-1,4-beta-mannosidase
MGKHRISLFFTLAIALVMTLQVSACSAKAISPSVLPTATSQTISKKHPSPSPSISASVTETTNMPTSTEVTNPISVSKVSQPEAQVYFGVYSTDLSQFEKDANKNVSIVNFFQRWEDSDFDGVQMEQIRSEGAIPLVTWEPWKGLKYGKDVPKYSLINIINGNFDTYIEQYAKAAKTWGHPFFLRLAQEMNGNWYAWSESENGNSRGQFVQAWRHVHDIFTNVGASNVSWVWCPGRVSVIVPFNNLQELYPGDGYVDWVGMDGYNAGNDRLGWQMFSVVFSPLYNKLVDMTSKPIMIAETSCGESGGGHKDYWITDALTKQIPDDFPRIKALVWFNAYNDPTADWQIESSTSAQDAFTNSIKLQIYGSNDYGSLNQSPIPIPQDVVK